MGYREATYSLQATSEVPVAHSIIQGNPHFGAGDLHQTYFPDMTANLQSGQVVVISASTHRPLPLTFETVTNSAGDALHTSVLVDFGKADTMALHGMAHNPAFPSTQAAAAFTNPTPYAPVLGAAGNAVSGGVRILGAHSDSRVD